MLAVGVGAGDIFLLHIIEFTFEELFTPFPI
jgi:hypothetical protein